MNNPLRSGDLIVEPAERAPALGESGLGFEDGFHFFAPLKIGRTYARRKPSASVGSFKGARQPWQESREALGTLWRTLTVLPRIAGIQHHY